MYTAACIMLSCRPLACWPLISKHTKTAKNDVPQPYSQESLSDVRHQLDSLCGLLLIRQQDKETKKEKEQKTKTKETMEQSESACSGRCLSSTQEVTPLKVS